MIVTPEKIARERITKWIKSEQGRNGKKQSDIANVLMTTQSNVSQRINTGTFKAYELILLSQKLDFDISKL